MPGAEASALDVESQQEYGTGQAAAKIDGQGQAGEKFGDGNRPGRGENERVENQAEVTEPQRKLRDIPQLGQRREQEHQGQPQPRQVMHRTTE